MDEYLSIPDFLVFHSTSQSYSMCLHKFGLKITLICGLSAQIIPIKFFAVISKHFHPDAAESLQRRLYLVAMRLYYFGASFSVHSKY